MANVSGLIMVTESAEINTGHFVAWLLLTILSHKLSSLTKELCSGQNSNQF